MFLQCAVGQEGEKQCVFRVCEGERQGTREGEHEEGRGFAVEGKRQEEMQCIL